MTEYNAREVLPEYPRFLALDDGRHDFQCIGIDRLGVAGAADGSFARATLVVDHSGPDVSVAEEGCFEPGNEPWCRGTQTAGFTANDATSGLPASDQCPDAGALLCDFTLSMVQNGAAVSISSPEVCDAAGNCTPGIDVGPYKIDSVPPAVQASAQPGPNSYGWNNTDVVVSFNCADETGGSGIADNTLAGATLGSDGQNPAVTSSGVCKDKAGNSAAAVTVAGIHIDQTAPDTSITTTPVQPSNSAAAQFGFSASDNLSGIADFECKLDGGAFNSCTNPVSYGALSDGTHTVAVRSIDLAGNADPIPASFTWLVDTQPPVVSCSVSPDRLAPPNHKLATVQATVLVTDDGSGPDGFTLISVTSSEPDTGVTGGDVPNDIQGFDLDTADTTGELRAERDAGNPTGRVYTLTYLGQDKAGNTAQCTANVLVPHDARRTRAH